MKKLSSRYALYIGRFQPFHEGHMWCINKIINEGNKVCIAIMDIHELEPKNNPYSFSEVHKKNIKNDVRRIGIRRYNNY